MAENGCFHEGVSVRRPDGPTIRDGTEANLTMALIPPDGTFEIVRYVAKAQAPHGTGDRCETGSGALLQTRLPISICTFANERQEGQLFCLHVRLRITEEYTQLRQIRCIIPLHPNCRPGSVQIKAGAGRAQVELVEEGQVTGAHNSVVSWEIEAVGAQTGNIEEKERIECGQEATLDIECAIAAPLILFPYHPVTGDDSRPTCIPADSLLVDLSLWKKWNDMVISLHKLDEMKRPFPRDRTSAKMQQRKHLQQLKEIAEHRLVSSCISRALPPVSVRIDKVFGPCFSGLTITQCIAHSTQFAGVHTELTEGDGRPNLRPMAFAQGTTNELACAELLFDLHRADFRQENADFEVPIPAIEQEPQVEEEPADDTKDNGEPQSIIEEATSLREAGAKVAAKAEAKRPIARGGAAKGGAAKGGAAKGKMSAVKKKK